MAISREDKHDVKQAFGKAIANKVSNVTHDRKVTAYGDTKGDTKTADMLRQQLGRTRAENRKLALRVRIKHILKD